MELEMWHMFIISNVILLTSLIVREIYYDTKNYKNLYSCLFVLVSIGLIVGTLISSILYASMESNIIQSGFNNGRVSGGIILGIIYFMSLPLTISIPVKRDFKEIMKKYKLNKNLIK